MVLEERGMSVDSPTIDIGAGMGEGTQRGSAGGRGTLDCLGAQRVFTGRKEVGQVERYQCHSMCGTSPRNSASS